MALSLVAGLLGPVAITISYDMSDYTFAENSTDAAVYLVATLDAAYPRGPSRNYFITFSTTSGTAEADDDYAPISERESFTRSEYGRDADTDPFRGPQALIRTSASLSWTTPSTRARNGSAWL